MSVWALSILPAHMQILPLRMTEGEFFSYSDRARSSSSQQEAETFSKLICKQFSLNTSVNLLGSVILHWVWAPAFYWWCILASPPASNTGSQVLKIKLLGWLWVRYALDPSTAVLKYVFTDLQWKQPFNGSLQFFLFFYQKKKKKSVPLNCFAFSWILESLWTYVALTIVRLTFPELLGNSAPPPVKSVSWQMSISYE